MLLSTSSSSTARSGHQVGRRRLARLPARIDRHDPAIHKDQS
jgi:hypothetical protein